MNNSAGHCIRRVIWGPKTFSRFYVLLQTIYCFRFDYAYLCRVYFSTLLLCICIISLGLKLLSSLFSSIVLTLIICILFSKKNAMVWVTLFCFLVQIALFWRKENIPREVVVFLKIFFTDFGSHECLVKKILILWKSWTLSWINNEECVIFYKATTIRSLCGRYNT